MTCRTTNATRADFLASQTNKRTGWVNMGIKLPESIADHVSCHIFTSYVCILMIPRRRCIGEHLPPGAETDEKRAADVRAPMQYGHDGTCDARIWRPAA